MTVRFGRMPRLSASEVLLFMADYLSSSRRKLAEHDYGNVFLRSMSDLEVHFGPGLGDARMLILGCGYRYPEVILWSTVSDFVVGVDTRQAFSRGGSRRLFQSLRREGENAVSSAIHTFLRRWGTRAYYRRLSDLSGIDLDVRCEDLVCYDGRRLPFSDKSLDVVYSNAVLEHVTELEGVIRETWRITAAEGICHHLWHNYYSLSGSHVCGKLAARRPWGHLLGDSSVDSYLRLSGIFLNRLPPEEIIRILSKYYHPLQIYSVDANHLKKGIDRGFSYEGEDLLTPEIQGQLSGIPVETLCTRAYLFIGKKRGEIRD